MTLNNTRLAILRGDKDIWEAVRKALGVTEVTMYRYIRSNDDNLTKAASLTTLREMTGLTDDEILEKEVEKV